ncbi:hydroxyacid dehydrogenase [Oscillospiraceae bacterium MB08-C2-2]|nr:hydroxyacid dehydrogenase [Oscillospiraceae bacterium MB08-C2-2]
MCKILVTEPIDPVGINYLREQGYEVILGTGPEEETILREAASCSGILTRNGKLTERVLKGCPGLRVVSMHGVGVDCIDVDAATRLGIQVTNAANSNQSSVAEYTIGLILMLAKNSIAYNNGLKSGNMGVRQLFGSDVRGKTLGIIGMGNIGTQVAHMGATGLLMRVIGYNRRIPRAQKTDFGLITPDMDAVISNADFLSLHLPGGSSTHRLIGKRELSLMNPTAYLINTGRGEVVDEGALIEALQGRKIAGAALDVFEGNLPKKDNPLLSMENVIATPHTAAFTTEALERMAYQAALGIVEVLENRSITYPVNKLAASQAKSQSFTSVMNFFRHEFGYC